MKAKEGFFIKRPIFATVISIVITLIGLVAMKALPIEQYPNMTPPQVMVMAKYNGANAETIAQSVASILESQINGVDDMIYMNSVSSGGSMSLNITFAIGTDPDMATINVNNRVQRALPQLPAEVQQLGITVIKRSPSILMIAGLSSPDGRYDSIYLSNYASLNVVDELKQVEGVGDAVNFASQNYSIRLWLNPDKLANLNLTPMDIASAVRSQNALFAAGSIGANPMSKDIDVFWQIIPPDRFNTPEQFGEIILRTNDDGSILRLKDVARIELGAELYNFIGKFNGADSLPIGVFLAPSANALSTAKGVVAKMEQLKENFPAGVSYNIPYDTTPFISISIEEVVKTLIEAMILVFIVVFLFLQSFRATLIPAIAVPVSIIGTFAGMYALGFSINVLTMFAMVLSIGMVVDDAIIVLENVERLMATGLSVRKATAQAMQEVTRPVIAVVLVLCSVFIPVAFTGGLAGVMYQQFAITIVISVVISGVVALTFTPAVCLLLLKKTHHKEKARFFKWFDNGFNKITNGYLRIVVKLLRHDVLSIGLYIAVLVGIALIMARIPTGLVPDEDQGTVMAIAILPEGASLSRTEEFVDKISQTIMKDPAVDAVMSFAGMDMLSSASKSNYGTFFIRLKDWSERTQPGESSFDVVKKIFGMGMMMPEGMMLAFNPPAISGMGSVSGFEMWIQNRAGGTTEDLYNYMQQIIAAGNKRPELARVSSTMSISSPELKIEVDREKALSMGVPVSEIFAVMQATFGQYYINDFSLYGRAYRVYAQSEQNFRSTPNDIEKVYVRSNSGNMVPLSSVVKFTARGDANTLERFNNFPAGKIMGNANQGYSSGQAMAAITDVARSILPQGYTVSWAGSSYQEQTTSGGGVLVLAMAMIMVFLILAAQYESWSLPIAVVVSVPFAVLGAALATYLRGYSNDIYFQVAIVTLVGLAAKNAILIVEFAIEKYRDGGKSVVEAAVEGARLRFRPIIMTSLAFIFGCLPLALSSGAGAASRHVLGTSVVGGMIFATVFAPMFVPFFFKWVMFLSNKLFPPKKERE